MFWVGSGPIHIRKKKKKNTSGYREQPEVGGVDVGVWLAG